MTTDECAKILVVASGADGGCSSCVESVVANLVKMMPDAPWHAAFDAMKSGAMEPPRHPSWDAEMEEDMEKTWAEEWKSRIVEGVSQGLGR